MKFTTLIILIALNLHGAIFGASENSESRESRLQQQEIQALFRQSASDANGVIKRGEYVKADTYRNGMQRIIQQLERFPLPAAERTRLTTDLREYTTLVDGISGTLQQQAPDLNEAYREVIGGLEPFNKRLSSIGLSELLREWHALSRIKSTFVKKPNAKLEKAFEQKWTSVVVTITELYLDEEMEEPLFEYLERYKSYFYKMSRAYKQAGYDNLVKVKPLSYKIKMQLELLAPHRS